MVSSLSHGISTRQVHENTNLQQMKLHLAKTPFDTAYKSDDNHFLRQKRVRDISMAAGHRIYSRHFHPASLTFLEPERRIHHMQGKNIRIADYPATSLFTEGEL